MSDPTNATRGVVVRTADLERAHAQAIAASRAIELPPPLDAGPGTELEQMLSGGFWSLLGIAQTSGCGCQALKAQMNAWGPDGCAEQMDEILDRLHANHAAMVKAKREAGDDSYVAPFLRAVARQVVGEAIRRARRAEAERRRQRQSQHGGGGGG